MGEFEAEGSASPVRMGDYLDEEVRPARSKVVQMAPPAEAVAGEGAHREPPPSRPAPSAPERHPPPVPPRAMEPPPTERYAEPPAAQLRPRAPQKRGRRKQINFFPDTKQALDEIIAHVEQYSLQGEPFASEVFYALVSIARDSLSQLDLSRVPLRGQHGSKNAQVYRDALAQAFENAIVAASQQRRQLS